MPPVSHILRHWRPKIMCVYSNLLIVKNDSNWKMWVKSETESLVTAHRQTQSAKLRGELRCNVWCNICRSGVFPPALSLRASSPPHGGAAPSPHTSSSALAPAASSALAPDAVAVGGKHFTQQRFYLRACVCTSGVFPWHFDELRC